MHHFVMVYNTVLTAAIQTRNQGFMAHLIYLICLSNYLSALLKSASNVWKIGLKCTENRPQMYGKSASNVQISNFAENV